MMCTNSLLFKFLSFAFCRAYFVFVALFVLGFVSSVLAKRLAGKSIYKMTYFVLIGTWNLTVTLTIKLKHKHYLAKYCAITLEMVQVKNSSIVSLI